MGSLAVKMLSRSTFLLPLCGPQQQQQQRAMSTLKAISMRLRSVKNIQKITKSMKMVSAAKYARAERELKPARAYGIGAKTFYEAAEIGAEEPAPDASQLLVAVTSDRGLCGAVHSSIAKRIRANYTPEGNYKIVCIGDKSRTILQRTHNQNILFHVSEVGKKAPSFSDATAVAQEILASGYEFNTGNIFFNIFRSVVSYDTSEVTQSYLEFSLASMLYYAMKEGACSEQSSRMTAMDNASKNAGEMIDKLTLTFNRTRQAVITRELIEIISGAAALK